jgi:2-polyprenyl-6-methoxyphenol hydroxylase-like FAD-dependent oxidoreductase
MSMAGSTDVDVAIVGAGVSGLVTAFELQRRGLTIEVLESESRPGGVIGTMHRDGALYETGPNSVLDLTPLVTELLDALHIRGERIETSAARRPVTSSAKDGWCRCHVARRVLHESRVFAGRSSACGASPSSQRCPPT